MNATIRTDAQLADVLGVHPKTIQNLKRNHGLRRKANGAYDPLEARALLDEHANDSKNGTSQTAEAKYHDTKYREYKALLMEAEYRKSIGELLERSEVIHAQVARELEFKRVALAIPRVAARLVGKGATEIEAILTEKVHEALRKLHRPKTR